MVLLSPVIQRMGASSQLAQQPALERMRRSSHVELHVRAHVRCLHQSALGNASLMFVSARPSTSVTQMAYAFWQRPVQQCALQMSKNAQMVLLSPVIQRMGASSQLAQQPALERMRRSRPVELHVRAHVRCLHQSAPCNACSVVSARPSTSVIQMVYAFWKQSVQPNEQRP